MSKLLRFKQTPRTLVHADVLWRYDKHSADLDHRLVSHGPQTRVSDDGDPVAPALTPFFLHSTETIHGTCPLPTGRCTLR